MAAVKKFKKVGPCFKNETETVRVSYDFSKDAGAVGVLDLFQAGADIIITDFSAVVKTACTSGGSATVKVGITGNDDAFMTTTQGAVASLTANAVVLPLAEEGTPNVLPCPVKLASGSKVLMTIGTAALTAGKIEFTLSYRAA